MIIISKQTVTKSKHHTCQFHKKRPFDSFAGCTCHSVFWNEIDENNRTSSLKEEFDMWDSISDEVWINELP